LIEKNALLKIEYTTRFTIDKLTEN
jgi:hypothetical protein